MIVINTKRIPVSDVEDSYEEAKDGFARRRLRKALIRRLEEDS